MIGLDTNVLVRFLVRDDEMQFARARRLLQRETGKGEPVLINLLVLLETEWVLRSRYALSKSEIVGACSGLLRRTAHRVITLLGIVTESRRPPIELHFLSDIVEPLPVAFLNRRSRLNPFPH